MGPESFHSDRHEANSVFNIFCELAVNTQFVKFSVSHTSLLIHSAKHCDTNNRSSIIEFLVCGNFTKSGP